MYKHDNFSNSSGGSLGARYSANNPFRAPNSESPTRPPINSWSHNSVEKSSSFERWVKKNEDLESVGAVPQRPPIVERHSETSIRSHVSPVRVSPSSMTQPPNFSNNPFADALSPRSTPPPPRTCHSRTRDEPRPPRRSTKPDLPPPSYDEVAGSGNATTEFPREKEPSPSRRHQSASRGTEERHRHRSHRSKSDTDRSGEKQRSSEKSRRHKSRSSKKDKVVQPKNLDTIDKLDVTGFFGGSGFHHDGPFDACTPHRNKDKKAAPVMAFPVDGPNSSIKGMAPVNAKDQQFDAVFGKTEDGSISSSHPHYQNSQRVSHQPYSNGEVVKGGSAHSLHSLSVLKHDPSIVQFDGKVKTAPVHGETTLGLGSSTFMDGAPAASKAEQPVSLGRKKSLAKKLKIPIESGRRRSYGGEENDDLDAPLGGGGGAGASLIGRVKSLKVGRR